MLTWMIDIPVHISARSRVRVPVDIHTVGQSGLRLWTSDECPTISHRDKNPSRQNPRSTKLLTTNRLRHNARYDNF